MPTVAFPEWFELVGSDSTLTLGSAAIKWQTYDGLTLSPDSRGGDLTYARQHGGDLYDRFGGLLAVSIDVQINGTRDQDGVAQADEVDNGWDLRDLVDGWPPANDRQGELRWHITGRTTRTADFRFNRFTGWTRPSAWIHETSVLLTCKPLT